MFYFWGYSSAFVVYAGLSYFFPAPETCVPATIYEDSDVISAGSFHGDGEDRAGSEDEKKVVEVESSAV
jgi:NCS1 family nucleobase:cation symporter-1